MSQNNKVQPNRQRCKFCGEIMPFAVKTSIGYVCEDCQDGNEDIHIDRQKGLKHYPTEYTDKMYHGGLFYRGEW